MKLFKKLFKKKLDQNAKFDKALLLQLRKAGFKNFPESDLLALPKMVILYPDVDADIAKAYFKMIGYRGRIQYFSPFDTSPAERDEECGVERIPREEYFYISSIWQAGLNPYMRINLLAKCKEAKKLTVASPLSPFSEEMKTFCEEAGIEKVFLTINRETETITLERGWKKNLKEIRGG